MFQNFAKLERIMNPLIYSRKENFISKLQILKESVSRFEELFVLILS